MKPRITTKIALTLEDVLTLQRLVYRAIILTRNSIDQSNHTRLNHLADTLEEAEKNLDL